MTVCPADQGAHGSTDSPGPGRPADRRGQGRRLRLRCSRRAGPRGWPGAPPGGRPGRPRVTPRRCGPPASAPAVGRVKGRICIVGRRVQRVAQVFAAAAVAGLDVVSGLPGPYLGAAFAQFHLQAGEARVVVVAGGRGCGAGEETSALRLPVEDDGPGRRLQEHPADEVGRAVGRGGGDTPWPTAPLASVTVATLPWTRPRETGVQRADGARLFIGRSAGVCQGFRAR
jgi:hypothetical protein